MIRPYSIHRTDRVPTLFEWWSALIIAFLLGCLSVGWFEISLDVYQCQFSIGWDEMINWRAE